MRLSGGRSSALPRRRGAGATAAAILAGSMKSSNSKTTPSVSTSYDFSRCPETQKLKSVCLCDACKDGPDLKAIAEQDAAWAAKKRAEKFAELDEIRRSSEAPGGGSSLAAAAAAARAEMPAGIKGLQEPEFHVMEFRVVVLMWPGCSPCCIKERVLLRLSLS